MGGPCGAVGGGDPAGEAAVGVQTPGQKDTKEKLRCVRGGLPPGRAVLGQGRRRGQSKAEVPQVCEGEQAGGGVGPPLWAAHSLVPVQSLQRSPGCPRAHRRILASAPQARWGSSPQCSLHSCPSLTPPGGAAVSGRWLRLRSLSVVALVPLPRPRVAMTGEATSLARLLLDSSCIGLFPARRRSHLKQGEARPFFESGRGRRTSGWRPSPPPASLPRSLSTWAQVRRLLLALLLRVQRSVL